MQRNSYWPLNGPSFFSTFQIPTFCILTNCPNRQSASGSNLAARMASRPKSVKAHLWYSACIMANTKEQAHELIDRMAPGQIAVVVGLLEIILDPVARSLANAPIDDEPVTPEEEKALMEAREWSKHHPGIPHEQVLAELGITQEEIERYQEPK